MNMSLRGTQTLLSHSCVAQDEILKLSKYPFTHQDNVNKTYSIGLLQEKELTNYGNES